MKPFWKNSRKKKTKNPSTPPQQKPRTRAKPKSMEEPWKPPMAVPPKAIGQERTPITQMLESARPVRKEYIPARPSTRKSEYYHEFRSNFQQLLSPKCRPIDIWRDFIVMVACAMSNTVDKAHYDEREKRYLESSTNTKNLSSIFSPNSMPLWSWLWMKTRNRTFSARCLWICTSTMRS